ncbi:hypothetical protein HFC70_21815 [Agrobacterium sp. a22-2]|uniref:hypothetical protein n=1 Tax=Agrobacterium sp. a22-2 TaxID=2283840 RepID=UPI001444AE38|nr:hypothetical protein [Agrobacterium sp. a22-2]NKN38995.1 hypothetical protein [Agrobacterium sp. a22-2]
MDIYSLTITHIHTGPQPVRMSARAEECYYSSQFALQRLSPGLLRSIVIGASVTLILGIALI